MDHFINVPGITTPIVTYCVNEMRARYKEAVAQGQITKPEAMAMIAAGMYGFMASRVNSVAAQTTGLTVGSCVIFVERDVYKELSGPGLVYNIAHEEGHCVLGHVPIEGQGLILNQEMEMQADDYAVSLIGDSRLYKESFLRMIGDVARVTYKKAGIPAEVAELDILAVSTSNEIQARMFRL